MPATPEYQQQRQTFLVIFLALLAGGGFLIFMIAVSGGFFLYLVFALVSIAVLGCLHYLVWGRSLMHQVAGEREEAELRDRLEADNDLPEEIR